MKLQQLFSEVAYKRLVRVDLPGGSNQHEINGRQTLQDFFKTSIKIKGDIVWRYFADNKPVLQEYGRFSFYQSRNEERVRRKGPEWRLYYPGDFLAHCSEGDVLVLARAVDRSLHGLLFEKDSAWLRAFSTLVPAHTATIEPHVIPSESLPEASLGFLECRILEELGFEAETEPAPSDEELASQELARAEKDGSTFPTTQRMACLAREGVDVDTASCDGALVAWLEHEERLFKAIERLLIDRRLKKGFASSDDFLSYSLSVHNRRKSRMGLALQNHLAELFRRKTVRFSAQATTEGKNRPDFLFPGQLEYRDLAFPARRLMFLAAKSTCKDRWRQILTEANRIPSKHLCTLDPNLSTDQMEEMKTQRVTLVLPETFLRSYSEAQRKRIWTVERFIRVIQGL